MSLRQHHSFQTDDPRLEPIHAKVMAGDRLDSAEALTLYRTGDILAVSPPLIIEHRQIDEMFGIMGEVLNKLD